MSLADGHLILLVDGCMVISSIETEDVDHEAVWSCMKLKQESCADVVSNNKYHAMLTPALWQYDCRVCCASAGIWALTSCRTCPGCACKHQHKCECRKPMICTTSREEIRIVDDPLETHTA